MEHDFDWSRAPAPWNTIGPEWRRDVALIVGGERVMQPPLAHEVSSMFRYQRPAKTAAEVYARHADRNGGD